MAPKRLKTVLREVMVQQGISQFELARKSGVAQGYISDLVGGAKTNPGLDVLKRLAKALGVTVSELLE